MGLPLLDRNTQKPNSMDTGVRKEEPRGAPTPPLRLHVLVTPPVYALALESQHIGHKISCKVQNPKGVTRKAKQ